MKNDAKIAMIARNLAEALQDFAYTRKDEDKKRVSAGQFELVSAVKAEKEPPDADQPAARPVAPSGSPGAAEAASEPATEG